MHFHLAAAGGAGVHKGFLNGLIGVLKGNVLTHKADIYLLERILEILQEILPSAQVRLVEILYSKLAHHKVIQMLRVHVQRYLVDAPGVLALYHVTGLDIAEKGNLAP